MRKKVGIIKRVSCISLVFLLSINSFAAIVSDNDGAAFITKAEFDALKNDFQSQIDSYNTSIDNKIDGAIASYLAGISLATMQDMNNLYEQIVQRYGGKILWGGYTDNENICTKNDASPCGSSHNLVYIGVNTNQYPVGCTHYLLSTKLKAFHYIADGTSDKILNCAPDIFWYLDVSHSELGNYSSGQSPWFYQPWSSSDSSTCILGTKPMKLGRRQYSCGTYRDSYTESGYIMDLQSYVLNFNIGSDYGSYFLMLPNYDGRGRGGNVWLTNKDYDGEWRTRWDRQGYHTTVDTVTNTQGSSSCIYLSTKKWEKSTGNYETGNTNYGGRQTGIGTVNTDFSLTQEQMLANTSLYLGHYDAAGRKEIYPETVKVGCIESTNPMGSSDRWYWGTSSTRIPRIGSETGRMLVQNFMWLEGNRVSSGGKKLSELTLTTIEDLLSLPCTMGTGVPITKADKDGDATIIIKCPQSGKYVFYKSTTPSATLGTEFTATGSSVEDTINIPDIKKGEYIFMKYLPDDGTELGYEVQLQSIKLKISK